MISIIIPAYNAEKTIEQCLESIVNQTYRSSHIIVVDDGSNDRTVEIVRSATERRVPPLSGGQSINLIQQENKGAQAARNRGFQELNNPPQPPLNLRGGDSGVAVNLGEGERRGYVLFCDADIVLHKDCLEKMVHALEEYPEASYAYSSFKFGWKKFRLWPFDAERLRQMPYIHTTSLIRQSAIAKDSPLFIRTVLGCPFDESIKRLQDWDLWLTMLEQGHTGVWVPEVLFKVISTKGTMSKWLPSFVYKLPFLKSVKKYNTAVDIIKQKHKILQY